MVFDEIAEIASGSNNLSAEKNNLYLHKMILKLKQQQ